MEKKITLDIAKQYYYISAPSSAHQAIFSSVFAYDALLGILSQQQDIELLGYCLFPDGIHLLLHSHGAPSKWLEPCLMQYNQWHQQASSISGYIFNDEALKQVLIQPKYLTKALKYLHQLPVSKKLCISSEQYLYSSFHDYINQQDTLVKTERILTMLSPHNGQRVRRFYDYMMTYEAHELQNFEFGNHQYYLAYSEQSYLTKARSSYETQNDEDSGSLSLELWQRCLGILCDKTGLDESTLRGIRRHHSLPDAHFLLAWLYVVEAKGPIYFASKQLGKDEETLCLNINSIPMHHPSSYLDSIRELWHQTEPAI